ncbi:MAG TPA: RNA methyltransferase [Flavisolibacter sp.]|jgi:TrmH family RNA methyltransferase|nr:RNA methyltransferase [Flavisolibacter sp.]
MLSKKVLKDIQSLSLKKHRDETGLFLAEGPKVVEELMKVAPLLVEKVYALSSWAEGREGVEIVSEAELEKASQMKTPNQVLAVCRQFTSYRPEASTFTICLDTIQDPGNFGTIIRIADWFGIENIVCSAGCADLYNSKVVQSTMASISRVNVYYDKEETWLHEQTVPVYAATLHGKSLYEFSKTEKGILIIGNESKGIRTEWIKRATDPVTIPRRGKAESLNAAVATGILLSHLLP